MDAENEHRIRLLSIAIQELDQDDADRLLDHMPERLARQIRLQADQLQNVSDDERQTAIEAIEELFEFEDEHLAQAATDCDSPVDSMDGLPLEAIIEVLSQERPIVIATILRHMPSRMGQSIVQQLEAGLARHSLHWITRLDSISSVVIEGILSEFRTQVQSIVRKLESQHRGEEKLRDLLAVLDSQRPLTAQGVQDGIRADGVYRPMPPEESLPGNTPGNRLESEPQADLKRQFVIPLSSKSNREESIELMMKLDDLDLLRVLYSHSADLVRKFLAGSPKAMRLRIEKLTPKNALKRLRRELASVPIMDKKAWQELAAQFAQRAIELSASNPSENERRISA
ncbi:MAG: hypothetical protein ACKOAU_16195 [Pirellula sp.]